MEVQVRFDQPGAQSILSSQLAQALKDIDYSHLVCLCIGTDRSTGDALGPLVGTFLSESGIPHVEIHGTLNHPIHATNLEKTLELITQKDPAPFILAIDACLGKVNEIGWIKMGKGPMYPGQSLKKNLLPVGHFYLKGVVNAIGSPVSFVLQNTRLNVVYGMAKLIAHSLREALNQTKNAPMCLTCEQE
jgi:putative sporulation protein YyaC